MKWIINIVLISTLLTGCYVPHPGNKVGVESPRVYYTETCKYNSGTSKWECIRIRKWLR